jgi:hypothetical protein
MWKIYKLTNKIYNEKQQCFKAYIGLTSQNVEKRFYEHCNIPGCVAIYNAIQKYGKENFTIEILHDNIKTEVEALKLETHYIDKYNTLTKNNKGYNILRVTGPRSIINGKLECRTCNKFKDINCFSNKKSTKMGKCFSCKDCDHEYYLKTKVQHSINNKKYELKNKEKIKIRKKKYRKNNSEKIKDKNKQYFSKIASENNKLSIEEIYNKTPNKTCNNCKMFLPSNNFDRENRKIDALNGTCKKCRAEYYQSNK